MSVALEVIVTAQAPAPAAYYFRGAGNPLTRVASVLNPRGETVASPCLAYVIRHPEAGTILVDTGLHPDAARDLRKDFGLPMSLVFRTLKPADRPFDEQLRERGVEPDEVERAVMTHLHVDHTSGMRLLPRARFTCTRREWAAAHARGVAARGFIARHLPPEERMDLVDLDRDGEPFGPFDHTLDLLGDGTIRLISTPGHTPGHLSLLVETGGGPVLIVGDAAYTLRSIEEQVLPLLTADDAIYARTLRALKAFADEHPEVPLVPTHDPDAWRAVSERARATAPAAPPRPA